MAVAARAASEAKKEICSLLKGSEVHISGLHYMTSTSRKEGWPAQSKVMSPVSGLDVFGDYSTDRQAVSTGHLFLRAPKHTTIWA